MADPMIDDGPFPSRSFGVLLHPSSFPGRDDIGTLGAEALDFVDWLSTTGATLWQILPLNINGQGDSPYFSPSAFAGNPWLIDLDDLVEHGLIDETGLPDRVTDARIPYDAMRERKRPVLWAAARRFLDDPGHPWRAGFDAYVETSDWLAPTCHFLALEDLHGGAAWWEWPDAIRRREPEAIRRSRVQLADEIARWEAVLYFFEVQWRHVRSAAHERGIRILGDLPIYVAPDSADVWLHQDQFQLDDDGGMVVQSGVPPDYFSATGQLWRNPLYRWDVMAADGYSWWISRLRRALELSDVVRIDHFRAMSAYWEVPGDADDALGGRWVDGPGQPFLDAVRAAFPSMPFVAEDLGTLDDDVYRLRDDNRLAGHAGDPVGLRRHPRQPPPPRCAGRGMCGLHRHPRQRHDRRLVELARRPHASRGGTGVPDSARRRRRPRRVVVHRSRDRIAGRRGGDPDAGPVGARRAFAHEHTVDHDRQLELADATGRPRPRARRRRCAGSAIATTAVSGMVVAGAG